MKKRDTIIVILLGIVTIAVILMGFRYRQSKQEELVNKSNYVEINQSESFEARQKKKEEEKRAKFLAAFDKKRESKTIADFLQYVKYAKGDTNVAFYGEIPDKAQWAIDNMSQLATERAFTEMQTNFVSTLESETIGERVDELVETKPDVVFFHTPMPVQGIVSWDEYGEPIEKDNITEVLSAYDEMKKALPEALIVLVTPAPREVDPEAESEISWHQVEIDTLVSESTNYAIPVFNIHNQVMEHLKTNALEIASLYNEDGSFKPETEELLKNMFAQNLKTLEVDTTTAYVLDGKPAEVDIVIEVYEEESSEEIVEEVEEESDNLDLEEEWYEEETEVDEWIDETVEEETYVPPVQTPTPPVSEPSQPAPPAPTPPTPAPPTESSSSEETSEEETSSSMPPATPSTSESDAEEELPLPPLEPPAYE